MDVLVFYGSIYIIDEKKITIILYSVGTHIII